MPIIKSAIKRVKQAEKRRVRRLPYKTHMKTMMKKVQDLAKQGKKDEAAKVLPTAYKAIDTAAKKSIIHKSNADKKKSLLARTIAKA